MASSSVNPSISVVIKTYDNSFGNTDNKTSLNLADLLELSLTSLDQQTVRPLEILVVDSSMTDGIAKAIQRHYSLSSVGIRRLPLAHKTFTHPKALNCAIQQAAGEIVVSLSGDATPANSTWLEELIAPFNDRKVAGTFSRHIARLNMPLSCIERFRLWGRYRSNSTEYRSSNHVFSNASSAFRRELALAIPFNESLFELEDYEWAKEIQRQGYVIAYVGSSEVSHSHQSSSFKTIWRMVYYLCLRIRIDIGLVSRL